MASRTGADRNDLTIDELAAAARTTTRRVRSLQTLGLLPHPELRGRTGRYGAAHTERLGAILRLQALGFSLESLGVLFGALDAGQSLAAVLGVGEPAPHTVGGDRTRRHGGTLRLQRAAAGGRAPVTAAGVPCCPSSPPPCGTRAKRRDLSATRLRPTAAWSPAAWSRPLDMVGPVPEPEVPLVRWAEAGALGADVAVTTRHGGASRPPYDSLNLGLHVGDDDDTVVANRRRAARAFGAELDQLVFARQVHGARVTTVSGADGGRGATTHDDTVAEADVLVTAESGVTLVIMVADCVPIALVDPVARVLGAVHAGWRGTAAGVSGAALEAMADLGARREEIRAFVGPAVASERYQVTDEVAQALAGAVVPVALDPGVARPGRAGALARRPGGGEPSAAAAGRRDGGAHQRVRPLHRRRALLQRPRRPALRPVRPAGAPGRLSRAAATPGPRRPAP